jgi:hypothetical protein
MRPGKALLFGVIGAAAISVVSALVRLAGLPLSIEMILGTLLGLAPGGTAFFIGLLMHLAIGGLFGLLYAFLFERVWSHGGAPTGVLLSILHASLIGFFLGFTPHFHPAIPSLLPDPGPYFAHLGAAGVIVFFAAHAIYGAVVGAGYGHVASERQWAPTGRL